MKKYLLLFLLIPALLFNSIAFAGNLRIAGGFRTVAGAILWDQIDDFTGTNGTRLDARPPSTSGHNLVSATGAISSNAAMHTETKEAAKGVSGITKANPGVITFNAGHGYSNGDFVYLSGLTEMTELNSAYVYLTGNSGDTFQIHSTAAYGAAETTGGNCAQKITLSTILSFSSLGYSEGRYWYTPANVAAGELAGIVICANDSVASTDGLFCDVDRTAGKLQVFKRVAGTDTSLISTAITYSEGAQACLVHDKTEGKTWVFYNGLIVDTVQALTDASVINNTWHGLISTGTATVTAVDFGPLAGSIVTLLTYSDSTLSGTPKVIKIYDTIQGQNYYIKVYPTIAAQAGSSGEPSVTMAYADDATLSGIKTSILFSIGGNIYYAAAYPTISSESGLVGNIRNMRGVGSGTLSGTPKIAVVNLDGTIYYFKIYPTIG